MSFKDEATKEKTELARHIQRALQRAPGWPQHESNGWSLDVILGSGLRLMRDEKAHIGPGKTSLTEIETVGRWLARWGYHMRRISERADVFVIEPGPVAPAEER